MNPTRNTHLRAVPGVAGSDEAAYEAHTRSVRALIDALAVEYRHGRVNDSARASACREKPELLRYWERILSEWNTHADDLAAWSRDDHPALHHLARVQAQHGQHGCTDRLLNEMEEGRRVIVHHAESRLDKLQLEIEALTRVDSRERGATLAQIEKVANDNSEMALWANRTRRALADWWRDKECDTKRRIACYHVSVLLRREESARASIGPSESFGVDIDALAAKFNEARRLNRSRYKGGADAAANWIVKELVRDP